MAVALSWRVLPLKQQAVGATSNAAPIVVGPRRKRYTHQTDEDLSGVSEAPTVVRLMLK